jgi:inorganic phosphate transporter, PiT family
MDVILYFGVILALAFNFVNGLNGAGNSIATVVATRALKPLYALILAAVCNIAGPFLLTTAIAKTIGTGIIEPSALTSQVIIIALLCGIFLLGILTAKGFPISASNTLIGCMVGASLASSGLSGVIWPSEEMVLGVLISGFFGALCVSILFLLLAYAIHGSLRLGVVAGAIIGFSLTIVGLMLTGGIIVNGLLAIIIFVVISPTLGFTVGFILDIIVSYIFRFSRQSSRNRIFYPLQIISGSLQALSNGANDGLHAVGIIAVLFIAEGVTTEFSTPFWVIGTSAVAIGIGTVFGGWNVITKMAKGITRIRPYQGFCASTAGGLIISGLTLSGIPTSSTHIISGSIVGVGATRGKTAVDWTVIRGIVTAWIVTFPLSISVSIGVFFLISHLADMYSLLS